jgi:Mg-chelatase subunit ChlD
MNVMNMLQQLFSNAPTPVAVRVNTNRAATAHNYHRPRVRLGTDKIALTGFNDSGFVIALPADPFAPWLHERVNKLPSKIGGQHTNIADGLRKSLDVLAKAPRGALKRIWLLSDGHPNIETDAILPMADRAREAWVNVNTIGFGDPNGYDEGLLRAISARTHNGKFVPVQSLRELSAALITNAPRQRIERRRHRAEYTILAVDCSGSMTLPMEGRQRIEVVREAVFHLLNWKQKNFA